MLNKLERRFSVAYVIQEGGLFPHLTAWKNIALVANYKKWTPESIRQRVGLMRADLQQDPSQASLA